MKLFFVIKIINFPLKSYSGKKSFYKWKDNFFARKKLSNRKKSKNVRFLKYAWFRMERTNKQVLIFYFKTQINLLLSTYIMIISKLFIKIFLYNSFIFKYYSHF